ncbi:acyl-CoA transferase [Limibaculum sp. FT325]|uniref:acyl-CoA transferase n=1 Tax=Thermohalobaculum sediminis TaxID=2939436 RepID=UPI0020BECD4A|nr:acyl-CoA transferase [Limibaculum sediminis]MCL5779187.1 acyl-CoA transferase [Limibaculum sediminis]
MPNWTTAESALSALFAALSATLPPGAKLLRNAILPERIPPEGVAILRDGDPGEPEILLSPLRFLYEHRAEIDIAVEAANAAYRDAAFDALKRAIGAALAADRTLGGRCDYVLGEAPAPVGLPIEGAEGLKAATLGIVLTYETADPLL